MSPYVHPFVPEDPDDQAEVDEPLLECSECEWVGPTTEFVPENYR